MKKFHEFNCLYNNGTDPVSGEMDYTAGIASIDLNSITAFNPFTLDNYTVVRLVDGNSFVVEYPYEKFKQLIKANTINQIVSN